MSAMSLACVFVGNVPALLVCRLIQGIGIGVELPVAAAYISELSHAHGRGRFFMLYEMIFPVGLMATGQIGAWVVPALGWKAMFIVGSVPAFVIAVLLARLPESPRWLIAKGRLSEAERIVEEIEASTDKRLPVAAISDVAVRPASMTNVAQVIVLLVCAFCIDRVGRRNWMVGSFVLGGALLAILGTIPNDNVRNIMILGTLSYGIIGSANAVLYLYTPEIYPTRMRAIGTGLATSWLRLASAVGPALVGLMVGARGINSVFLMFAAVSVVGALAATRMIETRGRRLEEIAP